MSEQAQIKAFAAAQIATEGLGALLTYGREGGAIDEAVHYDMVYPMAEAVKLALDAVALGRDGVIDGDDGQLYAALVKWIEATP